MDALVFHCSGCGAAVDVDIKTRKGHCEWCGNTVTFPRKAFNTNAATTDELALCVRCFTEKRFGDAKVHADNVLAVAIDNAPALYARAYYEAYSAVNKNSHRISEFFKRLEDIELDVEEVEMLSRMFISTVYKLEYNEEGALKWAAANLKGTELNSFVDSLSPALIAKRTSIDFFTPELAELYKQIAAECSIPKTCYALLQAITKNPASPYPNKQFFLKTKTQRFYQDFAVPVGEIIKNMASQELRDKFYRVYQSTLEDFKNKMNGGN